VLTLTLVAAATAAAAPLEIATRGQAQVVARRHAIDAAVASLTESASKLSVRSSETLGAWMISHPGAAPEVTQLLRDARMVRDEPADGQWHVTLDLSVETLRNALDGMVRNPFPDEPNQRLAGSGSAPIPWSADNVNDPVPRSVGGRETPAEPVVQPLSAPAAASNLPPIPERASPTRGSLQVALDAVPWASQVTLSATGRAERSDAAARDARRALSEALRALPISADASVGNWVDLSPANATLFEAHLGTAVESARRLTPDGVSEVDLVIPLRGLRRAIEESQL
jgi:hypothetical protein